MSERLRILIVPDWYPTDSHPVNGAFVRDQAQALARRHEVVVLFHDESLKVRVRPLTQRGTDHGVSVVRIGTGTAHGSRLGRLIFVLLAHRLLREMGRAGRMPDVIHAHGFSAAVLMLAATRGKVPLVVTEHFTDFLEGLIVGSQARIARYVFRHAANVCVVSRALGDALVRLEPRARVSLVPNVVDATPFLAVERAASLHEPPVVLTVASLERRKDVATLLDAVGLLSNSGLAPRVEIVGDGPLRLELMARAENLVDAGLLRFLGSRSRAEVASMMASADVLVMSSIVETFGIAAVEAAIAGLPVVASDTVPAVEEIGDEFAIAVPPGDAGALADAIGEVLRGERGGPDLPRRAELARRFGPEALLERLEPIYRAALDH